MKVQIQLLGLFGAGACIITHVLKICVKLPARRMKKYYTMGTALRSRHVYKINIGSHLDPAGWIPDECRMDIVLSASKYALLGFEVPQCDVLYAFLGLEVPQYDVLYAILSVEVPQSDVLYALLGFEVPQSDVLYAILSVEVPQSAVLYSIMAV